MIRARKRISLNRSIASLLLACIFFLICVKFLLVRLVFPEVYSFESSYLDSFFSKLMESPFHLADDVMISLRSGYVLEETGAPSFNRVDMANPSTSYLAPYLFALLIKFLPINFAVASYALLGFSFLLASFALIVFASRSRLNGLLLVAVLVCSTTFHEYALNGWDHLFSSAFLLTAAYLVLEDKLCFNKVFLIGVMALLGVGFRPDGLIIGFAVIATYFWKTKDYSRTFSLLTIFLSGLIAILSLNQLHFGYFTPTTARLKLGSEIPIRGMFAYIVHNGLFIFSAITILLLGLLFLLAYRRFFPRYSIPLVFGAVASGLYAFYVSDVFSSGRMFWVSSNLVVLLIAMNAPRVFSGDFSGLRRFNPAYLDSVGSNMFSLLARNGLIGTILLTLCVILSSDVRSSLQAQNSIVKYEINDSPTASQFVVAQWVNQNLDPSDGAVGLYWLGIGFHLPSFEIADFLGKADELIANQPTKWGPPGHNKWDSEASIKKWSPQVIIGPERNMLSISRGRAASWLQEKKAWGFVPELRLNATLKSSYSYCTVLLNQEGSEIQSWGFFLRNDIVQSGHKSIFCVDVT